MEKKKTKLAITGICNGKLEYITKDFKNLNEAYKFLGSFETEEDLCNFIYEHTGRIVTDLNLIKRRISNTKSDIIYGLMFKEDLEFCTINNLKLVLISKVHDSKFINKLINDKYCKSILDSKSNYDSPMSMDLYKETYFKGITNKNYKYYDTTGVDRNIVNFVDAVINNKEEINNSALRYMFYTYVKKEDYSGLKKEDIETLSELECFNMLDRNLQYVTSITEMDEKFSIIDNKKYYGDGLIENPNYERVIAVHKLDGDNLSIEDDDNIYFLTLTEAIRIYSDDLEMLKEISKVMPLINNGKSRVKNK